MRPIIFYDGACPLCRHEIAHYQRLDSQHKLNWVDISKPTPLLAEYGLSQRATMEKIHGITHQGEIVIGAYTFLMMWSALPYYRYLAWFINSLHAAKPLNSVYIRFARWRFKRRCSDGCAL